MMGWMPPVSQGDFLTFAGSALLSVVCQASGRGYKRATGPVFPVLIIGVLAA